MFLEIKDNTIQGQVKNGVSPPRLTEVFFFDRDGRQRLFLKSPSPFLSQVRSHHHTKALAKRARGVWGVSPQERTFLVTVPFTWLPYGYSLGAGNDRLWMNELQTPNARPCKLYVGPIGQFCRRESGSKICN
jgi:hypothetical protein